MLSPYALITVDELKAELRGGHATETGYDGRLEDICEIASDKLERWLDRLIITRGPITAYVSLPNYFVTDIVLREWPLLSVDSVHEDSMRRYGPDTLLVEDTDYLVSKPANRLGYLTRVTGLTTAQTWWLPGRRAIQVVYSAGYPNTAAVPLALKQECVEIAKLIYLESQKAGNAYLSTESTPLGNLQRWSSAIITKRADDALSAGGFKRPESFYEYEEQIA